MSEIFQEEFKDIKLKNKNRKTTFDGIDLPTACDDGFEERMSYKNIKYMIEEQGLSIEHVIFCTTAVYVMSIIEIKQAILFQQYGEELLKEVSKETILDFYLNLKDLKNINKLF